jgi:hypothetical protein
MCILQVYLRLPVAPAGRHNKPAADLAGRGPAGPPGRRRLGGRHVHGHRPPSTAGPPHTGQHLTHPLVVKDRGIKRVKEDHDFSTYWN